MVCRNLRVVMEIVVKVKFDIFADLVRGFS